MKIRLIKQSTIIEYVSKQKNSKAYFNVWLNQIKYADWKNVNDIKNTFKSADILGNSSNRVVFNIGGNNYRMICKYFFGKK